MLVQKALSLLTEYMETEKCLILLTRVFSDFIIGLNERFCWEVMEKYPGVQIIFSLLAQLGLQQHGVHRVDVSAIPLAQQHPLPEGFESREFALRWSEELGRLYFLHTKCSRSNKYFLGVACTMAFAGRKKTTYRNPNGLPVFPLVSPDELGSLEDAYDWEVPAETRQQNVSFNDAYNRMRLLGGEIHQPSGSSHYPVRFKGQRTWPLDKNYDPVPERHLKELVPITGQRLEVIKFVLLNGEWPRKALRLKFGN